MRCELLSPGELADWAACIPQELFVELMNGREEREYMRWASGSWRKRRGRLYGRKTGRALRWRAYISDRRRGALGLARH